MSLATEIIKIWKKLHRLCCRIKIIEDTCCSGGSGSQDLTQTLTNGNLAGGSDIILDDGSRLVTGTFRAGISSPSYNNGGGIIGVSQVCAAGYESMWENGERRALIEGDTTGFPIPFQDISNTEYKGLMIDVDSSASSGSVIAINSNIIVFDGDLSQFISTDEVHYDLISNGTKIGIGRIDNFDYGLSVAGKTTINIGVFEIVGPSTYNTDITSLRRRVVTPKSYITIEEADRRYSGSSLQLINTTTGNDTTDPITVGTLRINDSANGHFIGYQAGEGNSGGLVMGVGANSMINNIGDNVTSIGVESGALNTGSDCTFIGQSSGAQSGGSAATALGKLAGSYNTGDHVTALGMIAAQYNTGNDSTFIGYSAGLNNSGMNVVAVGRQAGENNINNDCNLIGVNASATKNNQTVLSAGRTTIRIDHRLPGITSVDASPSAYIPFEVDGTQYYIKLYNAIEE